MNWGPSLYKSLQKLTSIIFLYKQIQDSVRNSANLSQINTSFFPYNERTEKQKKRIEKIKSKEKEAKKQILKSVNNSITRIYTLNTVFLPQYLLPVRDNSSPARITMALISKVAKKLLRFFSGSWCPRL